MAVKRTFVFLVATVIVFSVCSPSNGAFLPQGNLKSNENRVRRPDSTRGSGRSPDLPMEKFSENQQDKNVLPIDRRGFLTPQKDIIDIKPLEKIERDYREFFLITAAAILLIAFILLAYFYYKRRRRVSEEIQLLIPAHKLALQEFNALKEKRLLENGDFRKYYFEFSEIFRRYLERRFLLPATERTAEEIIPALQQIRTIAVEYFSLGRDFLLTTDLVKFAKYFPMKDEIDKIEGDFLKFIEMTKEDLEKDAVHSGNAPYNKVGRGPRPRRKETIRIN